MLNTHGEFYFNDISCFDADNCIAAAEGMGSAGYHTTDGGASWKMIIDTDASGSGSSMMATAMISATEFWYDSACSTWSGFGSSSLMCRFVPPLFLQCFAFYSDGSYSSP